MSRAQTQEIVTDRPDVTEASVVIPVGSLQLENGATWTASKGSHAFDLSESLLRLDIASRTEIRIVIPNYLHGITGGSSGFEDFALGIKQQPAPLPGGVDPFGNRRDQPPDGSQRGLEPRLRSIR